MTIAEVSKKMELSTDTLRYYERIGIIPEVERSESGIRNYTEHDLVWIEFAKYMRSAGMGIESLIEYIKLYNKGDATLEARKQLLIDQRETIVNRINELKETLEKLDFKIQNYDTKMRECENRLSKNN